MLALSSSSIDYKLAGGMEVEPGLLWFRLSGRPAVQSQLALSSSSIDYKLAGGMEVEPGLLWFRLSGRPAVQSQVTHGLRAYDGLSLPEDAETVEVGRGSWTYSYLSDDEDLLADDASGDDQGSGDLGSGEFHMGSGSPLGRPPMAGMMVLEPDEEFPLIYFRALVNFTHSIEYSPRLEDAGSKEFREVSEAVVDLLESEYLKIPGDQVVSVVFIKEQDGWVFVELDVGSEGNSNGTQIQSVLHAVVSRGAIGPYTASLQGFQFRRLGAAAVAVAVTPVPQLPRLCTEAEFACHSYNECVALEYHCDRRPDCRDMSDELNCGRPVPCEPHEAACHSGHCIPEDYVCDGQEDCTDGSDELDCGPSPPCEPNEFPCGNGHCALKLWHCDGDFDCEDRTDEANCPAQQPGEVCGPTEFRCVSTNTCIPASFHCDEESDCPDRSDEFGCMPPQVVTPPQELIQAFRGQTVTFTCAAIGVPTPIINWRLNWGHIPSHPRVTVTSEDGRGTLTIRDVKEADQGAYTCEAMNARGMVFGIPDGVLELIPQRGPCPDGHFYLEHSASCLPCFCFGVTSLCQSSHRFWDQIRLRFDRPDDVKGVNVTMPAQPGMPPLSSTQQHIDTVLQEFQLVDLSRRFLIHDSFWALPEQFLGNKVDSYGGFLRYKVRYELARGALEPVQRPDVVLLVQRPDVVLVGAGRRLLSRGHTPTHPSALNQRQVQFSEEHWVHESGQPVQRAEMLQVLQSLEAVLIQTVYNTKMASVGLSDVSMDTTVAHATGHGRAHSVEECRCPIGYSGLSCESCDAHFTRVPGGPYLGTCSGCNCNGHASSCDPVYGHCLNCQHNTEGPQCNKCKAGFFGDATKATATACRPCPCPYIDASRRFSDTCFLDTDGQATCDACAPGYTGRRCESCAPGYEGNPIQPGGKCRPTNQEIVRCDERGSLGTSEQACRCKNNVVGRLCNECADGSFHLSTQNPDGCLKCFCMGVSRRCTSSSWSRSQVHGASEEPIRFSLVHAANTHITSEGISSPTPGELVFSSFHSLLPGPYFWSLPPRFRGDKVTSYGGELRFTVTQRPQPGSTALHGQPLVVLQGNGIVLEHHSARAPSPGQPSTYTVPFREVSRTVLGALPGAEQAWQRSDGLPATREHLLMALAGIDTLLIQASYTQQPAESRLSGISMDVAVPEDTGQDPALEVEHCTCPPGYRGPSCQDCDTGYTRTPSGLYLGTCERCSCHGHAEVCEPETGTCQGCQHHTDGPRCEQCQPGYYGDAQRGTPQDCQPCPCYGTPASGQAVHTCFLDTDGHPTCDACSPDHSGRLCERCAPGYYGNPSQGQPCRRGDQVSKCDAAGQCQCKGGDQGPEPMGSGCDPQGSMGSQCDAAGQCQCKAQVEGLTCSHCRPHHFHLSASNPDGCLPCFCMGITQQCASSSYTRHRISTHFAPGDFQGFALVNPQRNSHLTGGFTVEPVPEGAQLSFGNFAHLGHESFYWQLPETYQGDKVDEAQRRMDAEIWQLLSSFAAHPLPPPRGPSPRPQPAAALRAAPGYSPLSSASLSSPAGAQSSLTYDGFSLLPGSLYYWQLPRAFLGNKVAAYGGKLRYTLSYRAGPQGSPLSDPDVQITGNNIMLVASQPAPQGPERKSYEVILRELLVRATFSSVPLAASISAVSLEVAQPGPSEGPRALEVEECRCPPGYVGLSCQDCAPGYTRTGSGLYLGHCELCECNGHSDLCHPETGACSQCQHNAAGEFCELCAPGYYGDATAGTPEDCQPCACPLASPENMFSRTCESLGAGGYRCTACEPGYTGQYCEQCAPGYVGNPNVRGGRCLPQADQAPLVVQVHPARSVVPQGGPHSLQCQVSGSPPHYFYWSREDGRPLPSSTQQRHQGSELHFPSVQPSDAGVYICTCRNLQHTNSSRAELLVAEAPSKPITVTVEEQRSQSVRPGADVTFICTAKSKSPAYTLVWTRMHNGKLPSRAMDFNGILTIRNVQPSDAGTYVCTGSNMFAMDQGTATLHVQASGALSVPVVSIHPPQLTVQPGQLAEFRCSATGNPTPMLEWTGGPGGRLPQKAQVHGGILRLPAVEPSDQAQYLCRAHSIAGQQVARAVLHVHGGNGPRVQVSPERTQVHEGRTVRLYCRAAGVPGATITWKKEGGSLPPQARYERTDIATLLIPAITADNAGFYVCVATSPAGTAQARIQVVVLPASGASTPPVTIESSSPSVTEGQTLDLSCVVAGPAPAQITWYKRGGSLPPHAQVHGARLRLPQVSPADSGEYVCRVENGSGPKEASIIVSVLHGAHVGPNYTPGEESAPGSSQSIRIESSSSHVAEGQTLDLTCVVPGQAHAQVTWYKRGGSLPARHQTHGPLLRLHQVSPADSGEYVCRVILGSKPLETSVLVTIEASGSLPAPGPVPPVRIESSSSTVTEGQTLDLNCVVAGQAHAQVTWYKRGGSLPPRHQVRGSRLYIFQASPADAGEYVCRASDGVEASLTVTVLRTHGANFAYPPGGTQLIRIESSSSQVAEGQTLDLNCVVPGQAHAQVTWHKRGGSLPARHQTHGSLLRLHQVSPADSGEYMCRVVGGSVPLEASVLVTIEPAGSGPALGVTPPVRIETSSSHVAEGQTLDLNCLVTGQAHAQVTWHKRGGSLPARHQVRALGVTPPVRIETSSSHVAEGQTLDLNCLVTGQAHAQVTWHKRGGSLPARHQVHGSRLRLPQLTLADSGEYVCRVVSSSGTQEASVLITIQQRLGPSHPQGVVYPVRIESSSASLANGHTLDLNCLVASQAPHTITWYKRGGSLPSRHQIVGSRLRIPQVTPADSGEYVCHVSNGAGSQETSLVVTIEGSGSSHVPSVSPPIRIESSSPTVVEGQTLDLNCVVAGQPQASITWYKRGGSLPSRHQAHGSHLRLHHMSVADSGEYVCRANNNIEAQEASILVSVLPSAGSPSVPGGAAPIRIESSSSRVAEGQTLDLNCVVPGQAHAQVTWHKRGGSLPSHHQAHGSRLRLYQVSPADSGEYMCRVVGSSGPLEASVLVTIEASGSGTVHVPAPGGAPPIRIETSSSHVAEGQTLDLTCVVPGQAHAQVTWHKRGGSLPARHQTHGPLLRLNQVSPADSGEYLCRVTSSSGTLEASILVTIEASDPSPIPAPGLAQPIHIEASSSHVAEGQTLDLNCVVPGQAHAQVTWHKRGGSLPARHQAHGSQLRLHHVSPADSGEYVCRVAGGSGPEQEASFTVTVPPSAGSSYRLRNPVISIDPPSSTVQQGQDASFKCLIHEGAAPIRLEWKTRNQELEDNVRISPNGSIITIVGARPSNHGAYRCMASNAYGVAQSVVNLSVHGPPTVSVLPESPVRVKVGKAVTLECVSAGEPRSSARWTRIGTPVKLEQRTFGLVDSHTVLQISSAEPSDAGTYVCLAQNALGTAQKRVEVIVDTDAVVPGAPQVQVEEAELTVEAGRTATLRCSATGSPAPTIHWSKLRSPLPWQHQLEGDTLIIPRIAQQDSGQYICNATSPAGHAEATVVLHVESPPYATVVPEHVPVRAGETVQLQCLAHGTPPLSFQWSRVGGSLPARAAARNQLLHLEPVTPEDSGHYRCQVTNRVGSAEAFAQVLVQGSTPTVQVTPQLETKSIGASVEFHCAVPSDQGTQLRWFKDGGQLPPGHSVQDGVLRIQNLDQSCQGTYICQAHGPWGQAQASAQLVVQALPSVLINIRTSVQTVVVGHAVEFECLALGDPKPQVTWSKVGGRLRPGIVQTGSIIRIAHVELSDAGQYRCTATNAAGTTQSHVLLLVQALPQISTPPEVRVPAGSAAVFPCMASGYPTPDITWSKLDGSLPPDSRLENNMLMLPSVRPQDAGTYVCTATNRQGKVKAFAHLQVPERVVPYFTQTPHSFLPLPTIKDAYRKFEIRITFRPDSADGMLLYNGQKRVPGSPTSLANRQPDFISFGLVGGRPEFRFDAGSGMATIRHPTPLALGQFHTVTLLRSLTQGSLIVGNLAPVNGTSQGKFQGLDLNEELYLGGYPDYGAIPKAGLSSGFIGCVRELRIQGEEIVFHDLNLTAHGIAHCPTCRDRPCQNGGQCHDSESSSYVCVCPAGFTGSRCEHSQALHCHPEACGPDATCVNRPDGRGYTCRCHLGRSGTSRGAGGPVEDFVSLAMVGGHLEFRYELGSGLAVLRSAEPLALGRWHRVSAERLNKDGSLRVNGGRPVLRSSPGKSQGLNLQTLLYLGGVEPSLRLSPATNVSTHFRGCVGEVSVNGKRLDLTYSFLGSRGIGQCYDSSPCERQPCQHGATCMPAGEYEFQCLCGDGFKGDLCELEENPCQLREPCLHGGTCQGTHCLCLPGFSGPRCQQGPGHSPAEADWLLEGSGGNDAPGQYGAYFHDNGFLALPSGIFSRSLPEVPEIIEMEVRTSTASGLLLWQGVEVGEAGQGKDFISLGLQDGHPVFSYQLGSGEARLVSEDPINDGEWHRVTVLREGRRGSIQVDGEEMVSGQSPGPHVAVNTKGSVYIGGAPAVAALTRGRFSSGITGCIKNLVLHSARPGAPPPQPLDLQHRAQAGANTKPCPSYTPAPHGLSGSAPANNVKYIIINIIITNFL
ncbi:Basement membrane-specific heparan sulfate proteoglycan core protein [Tupaia chinensis]|uniref:Basement membrane-specific heparan sulfate proteoglycan core protein n=1 Tax=Tupaia chinensis TaxID=246437 RepID=L9L0Q8_TUPCH|nr:Basement membrane-specific heparan sulfate proteoglycan core protein [Tupaia chinensis]